VSTPSVPSAPCCTDPSPMPQPTRPHDHQPPPAVVARCVREFSRPCPARTCGPNEDQAPPLTRPCLSAVVSTVGAAAPDAGTRGCARRRCSCRRCTRPRPSTSAPRCVSMPAAPPCSEGGASARGVPAVCALRPHVCTCCQSQTPLHLATAAATSAQGTLASSRHPHGSRVRLTLVRAAFLRPQLAHRPPGSCLARCRTCASQDRKHTH
jgi:hypothetical protein